MLDISGYLFSAIMCPQPPIVIHSTNNNTGCINYGCLVTYSCADGTVFEDGFPVKTISCTNLGQWSEVNFTCGSTSLGNCILDLSL